MIKVPFDHWTTEIDVAHLAEILKEAKDWHTKYEVKHGPDKHWEAWYASFIKYRLMELDPELAADWTNVDLMSVLNGPMGRKDPI